MELNWIAIFVAALVTLLVGMLWYSDAGFGKIWMKEAGLHPEDMKKGNIMKIFGLTILYSLMISIMVSSIVVHQFSAYGMIGGTYDPDVTKPSFMAFMNDYGTNFRTFGHGALHGFITGLFFILPVLAINGLFERKSWKYILIHAGYWIVTLTIMGAIICGWV